jgi:hypothetical protein
VLRQVVLCITCAFEQKIEWRQLPGSSGGKQKQQALDVVEKQSPTVPDGILFSGFLVRGVV